MLIWLMLILFFACEVNMFSLLTIIFRMLLLTILAIPLYLIVVIPIWFVVGIVEGIKKALEKDE